MDPFPTLAPYARETRIASGLRLFYFAAGDPANPPMLLIHGLGDEADTWRHVIPALAERFYVIAPDLPGFGRSDQPDTAYSLDFLTASLLGLLHSLGIPKAWLVGSSLGGILAQSIALSQPERVERLALLDGSLLARRQPLSMQLLLFLVPGLGEWMYKRLRRDPAAAYASLRPYYANLDGLPQADQDFLYQRVQERVWSDGQRRAYLSVLRSLAGSVTRLQKDLPARLAALATPTLVMWGEQDQINPIENAHALAQAQPSARLVTLADCGHLPHQERPQETLAALLDF
ncbi:MAG: alpha/beta fold hydrolase [Chloroflexota bacterium]